MINWDVLVCQTHITNILVKSGSNIPSLQPINYLQKLEREINYSLKIEFYFVTKICILKFFKQRAKVKYN